jgi:outer membrane lipoprotein SlyB
MDISPEGATMKKYLIPITSALVAATIVSGCAGPGFRGPAATQPYPVPSQPYPMPAPSYSSAFGVIDSIQTTPAGSSGNAMGIGAVLGGVVGGLLGNQVGGGTGRTAATVAGAIGGAMVGNQVEQRNNTQLRNMYQIGVRLDNGSYQTVMQDNVADLQIGNRVRIENDRVYRY